MDTTECSAGPVLVFKTMTWSTAASGLGHQMFQRCREEAEKITSKQTNGREQKANGRGVWQYVKKINVKRPQKRLCITALFDPRWNERQVNGNCRSGGNSCMLPQTNKSQKRGVSQLNVLLTPILDFFQWKKFFIEFIVCYWSSLMKYMTSSSISSILGSSIEQWYDLGLFAAASLSPSLQVSSLLLAAAPTWWWVFGDIRVSTVCFSPCWEGGCVVSPD